MINIKDFSTKELVSELKTRAGVRSVQVNNEESHKVQVATFNDGKNRFIKGDGPAIILEVID